jgi:hypothetical protein
VQQSQNSLEHSTSDKLYIEAWDAALARCREKLEDHDHERALQVKTVDDFCKELQNLEIEFDDEGSLHVIRLLYPILNHYHTFAQFFVEMMAHKIEVSMMWGLLFLVVKVRQLFKMRTNDQEADKAVAGPRI